MLLKRHGIFGADRLFDVDQNLPELPAMKFTIANQTITVNVPTWAVLEARVAESLVQRKGFALATINLDHLVKLRSDAAFRKAYAAQDLICADGNPIVWLARIAGEPMSLIPGSDAILPLARIAARQGIKVALVGSNDQALKGAKSYLEREVRHLEVALCIAPPMGFDPIGAEAEALLSQVADSGARLCFVAMGAPKQEQMAALGRRIAPEVGFVSIGAGLDFFAGLQQRAPDWVRKIAMEWLWRALGDPRRLALRYARCFAILPGHVMQAVVMRLRG